MFGTGLSVPVPDLDRTDYLLMLGANPMVSNGSLMTAPDVRGRLRAIRARGGKVVVVDPRRSRTAGEADEHHFIRPGTDALLLFALVHTLFDEDLVRVEPRLERLVAGSTRCARSASRSHPRRSPTATGIAAETIRRMARELAAAPSGRRLRADRHDDAGVRRDLELADRRPQPITGNLDRPGGAMFTEPAFGEREHAAASRAAARAPIRPLGLARARAARGARRAARRRAMPRRSRRPGEGQIRALITIAGNPVLSTPNGDAPRRALDTLELWSASTRT